ncbi:MAG: DNRLRE domain-containing protein [Candidatus Promineifilaceae bacterium]|nr:DNRLRE domain-containing protein [Candidatus Promineifilaceae bacterium]
MKHKPLILLTLLLLTVALVTSVGAQESIMNKALRPPKIIKQEVTPDGVNTIVELSNTKDTFVSSNQPGTNFGSRSDMQLGYSLTGENLGAVRPMLQFDTDSIPKQAVINSATLRIYLSGVTPPNDSSMGYKGVYLKSSWSEHSVTWNSHQPEWGSEIGIGQASSQLGWHEGDVTKMVRDWVSGSRPNFGFIVIGDEAVRDRLRVYFTKDAGNGLDSRIIVDYTVSTDNTPPVANVKALPQWSPANYVVEWEGYDPDNPDGTPGSGIRWYDVFDSQNNGSTWSVWRAQVTETKTNFEGGEHLQTYSFTARARDNAGNEGSIGGVQASTTVDAVAPVVSMTPLPPFTTSSTFTVSWGGTDSGSGIASYDVQWREQGQDWRNLFENTTLTNFTAQGAEDGVTYEFRARGTDKVGNHQQWTDVQTSTTVVLAPTSTITGFDPHPIFQNLNGPEPNDSFTVFWQGYTAPGTTPLTYNVRYRKPGGNWLNWTQVANTQLTSGVFVLDINDPDGTYEFEVAARNNAGQQEQFTGEPEGSIIVDRHPPFIEPSLWLPVVVDTTQS